GPGGDAVVNRPFFPFFPFGPGVAIGGASIAIGSANGGAGGAATVSANPVAITGNSGHAVAQSSATNFGWTGPAFSLAVSNPVALSGRSGSTGATGPAASFNPILLLLAILFGR
ncbi:MAG: hypothetical protein M3O23_13050, partial [Actinomycetota bacterium]|nr:hypothetical protein [Actinomycetota bacterium]